MPDVVCIGETMLRLSAPAGSSLENTPYLQVDVAGAESNVAIGLSRLGVSVGWISRLPDNSLGRRVADVIRGQGVDVSRVVWAPEGRLGVYFIELGQPPRPSQIIYDRAHSAMAQMQPDEWIGITCGKRRSST
jgi:2-dehydro-3-deoxygluconokinase